MQTVFVLWRYHFVYLQYFPVYGTFSERSGNAATGVVFKFLYDFFKVFSMQSSYDGLCGTQIGTSQYKRVCIFYSGSDRSVIFSAVDETASVDKKRLFE